MLPTPSNLSRNRRSTLSIGLVPEHQPDAAFRTPHPQLLVGSNRRVEPSLVANIDDGFSIDKAGMTANMNDAMLSEVVEWLQLNKQDSQRACCLWQLKHFFSLHNVQLPNPHTASTDLGSPQEVPYALLHFIALRLLASCYTLLPASSAENFPLHRQRTSTKLVSSLRLHSHYRLSPAAGHHARAPSESSPWPGLSTGPSLEDQLVELVTGGRHIERRLKKPPPDQPGIMSTYTPMSQIEVRPHGGDSASETMSHQATDSIVKRPRTRRWANGYTFEGARDRSNPSGSSYSSSSASNKGLLSRLLCQPSQTKRAKRRKRPVLFGHGSFLDRMLPSPSPRQGLTLQSSPKSPATVRLHQAKSTSRTADNHTAAGPALLYERRSSSNPTIESPQKCHFEIPEIRKISATTVDQDSNRRFGRGLGDILTAQEYLDESRLSPGDSFLWTRKLSVSSSKAISPASMKPDTRRRQSSYFGGASLALQVEEQLQVEEEKFEGFDNWMQQYQMNGIDNSPCDDGSSEDSVDLLGKRKSTVSRPVMFDQDSLERLKRRSSESVMETANADTPA